LQTQIFARPMSGGGVEPAAALERRLCQIDTQLHSAADHGNLNEVTRLVREGANVHSANEQGSTALHLACQEGHEPVAAFLLEEGADPNAKDNESATPLMGAAYYGHLDILQLLLGNGADVHSAADDGRTALHLACQEGHEPVAAFLVEEGANVGSADEEGTTALHLACCGGDEPIAAFLLEQGADPNARTNESATPLMLAAWNANNRPFNPNPNAKVLQGPRTAFGHLKIVQRLLWKGADATLTNGDGNTARDDAGLPTVVDALDTWTEKAAAEKAALDTLLQLGAPQQ